MKEEKARTPPVLGIFPSKFFFPQAEAACNLFKRCPDTIGQNTAWLPVPTAVIGLDVLFIAAVKVTVFSSAKSQHHINAYKQTPLFP